MEQIKIIPGVTDLSTIDLNSLVVMKQSLTMQAERDENCIKCELSRIETENEELKIMQAEIARMEAEIKRRSMTVAQKVKELINESKPNPGVDPYGFLSRTTFDDERGVIMVPLPNCNTEWSFQVFKWAMEFCRKNPNFYPTHYDNQSPRYMYIKLDNIRYFQKLHGLV